MPVAAATATVVMIEKRMLKVVKRSKLAWNEMSNCKSQVNMFNGTHRPAPVCMQGMYSREIRAED